MLEFSDTRARLERFFCDQSDVEYNYSMYALARLQQNQMVSITAFN